MSNIDDLQRRITAAMDRVAQGLDSISGAPSGPDPETLQALEDERTANAQLTERVRTLRTNAENELAAMRADLEEGAGRMGQLDTELQRLRQANQELVAACDALRAANAEGLADPALINAALVAELEGLRAARASDAAETAAILGALEPLLENAGQTPNSLQEGH